jgi:hypothetical protein
VSGNLRLGLAFLCYSDQTIHGLRLWTQRPILRYCS